MAPLKLLHLPIQFFFERLRNKMLDPTGVQGLSLMKTKHVVVYHVLHKIALFFKS